LVVIRDHPDTKGGVRVTRKPFKTELQMKIIFLPWEGKPPFAPRKAFVTPSIRSMKPVPINVVQDHELHNCGDPDDDGHWLPQILTEQQDLGLFLVWQAVGSRGLKPVSKHNFRLRG